MLKTKIFAADRADNIETALNDFIKDEKVIDIKFTSLYYAAKFDHQGTPIEGCINDRVLVIYEV